MTILDSLLVLCRPGFEADCAAELTQRTAGRGMGGYARARRDAGWLSWHTPGQDAGQLCYGPTGRSALIFPRTAWPVAQAFSDLPAADRVTPLVALARPLGPFSAVRLEYADTNEGRGLQRFIKGFRQAFERALKQQGLLLPVPDESSGTILHLFFEDSGLGVMGCADARQVSLWENGIPRLRLPAVAPSRSALKLEEAWLTLMTPVERAHWLRAGRSGVDLGAAPGGWTWQLARHGVRVTAVDHGKLAPHLLSEYPVTHVAGDAFTWRAPRTLDWLVCDVVDKPSRTLALMEKWLVNGWAKVAVFNLKLPMKHRHATVDELLQRLEGALAARGTGHTIRAAQLYHDREEITVAVVPASGA
ncbi:MAG: 23S rRNA (cytidine(2498)-2'-O)-methyltransferase RlmM [Alcanivorax sp.]|nr:23S rRNA (cytidine(2498)-2'-O)-methyltransferase RlmM [Alcanivorax sp.]